MQVTIKYVNFPKPGGKFGRLITADGQTVWVGPELIGMFRSGMTCEIGVKQQTWGQGETAKDVTIATSGPLAAGNGAQQGNGYGQGTTNPNQQPYVPQRPNTGFTPRVVQGGGNAGMGTVQAQADQTRWNFLMGIIGRSMGSGKFAASEIPMLAQEAARAYALLTDPPPPPVAAAQPREPDEPTPPGPEDFGMNS